MVYNGSYCTVFLKRSSSAAKTTQVFKKCSLYVTYWRQFMVSKRGPNNPSCTFIKFTKLPVGNAFSVSLTQRATHQLQ